MEYMHTRNLHLLEYSYKTRHRTHRSCIDSDNFVRYILKHPFLC